MDWDFTMASGDRTGYSHQAVPLYPLVSSLPCFIMFKTHSTSLSLCLSTTYLYIIVAPDIPLAALWVETGPWMSSAWWGRGWAYLSFF